MSGAGWVVLLAVATGCGDDGEAAPDAAPADASAADASADAAAANDAGASLPTRRGLCVIVDFANAKLEDWSGPGVNSVVEVNAQLAEMEAHWDWLARGQEKMEWDLIRIELARNLSRNAFGSSRKFRDEVVRKSLEQVSVADYDFDGDGVLDTIFAIVADQGMRPHFATGGTSRNQGAGIFVVWQDSSSLVLQATGDFTHETAHTLEVSDLYGTYDTIGDLSVMAGSRALPANDFTALERIRLGWVDPVVVDATTTDVPVLDANANLYAIKIPTERPEEYFLLEYRRPPATGFGSAGFDHDGLAVYHVFEASDQKTNPPLLKLEPADRVTSPFYLPDASDLASPEDPGLQLPWVLRTYFGGEPVVSIDGLRRSDDGALAVDISVLSPDPGSVINLVANASLEEGTEGWSTRGAMPEQATFTWANVGAGGSDHSLRIKTPIDNDVEWTTQVGGLVAGRPHYLCGWLSGQEVNNGAGASLAISGTSVRTLGAFGTFDWTRRCVVIPASADTTITDVACRLGGVDATTRGTMWCDDVTLTPLDSAFVAP